MDNAHEENWGKRRIPKIFFIHDISSFLPATARYTLYKPYSNIIVPRKVVQMDHDDSRCETGGDTARGASSVAALRRSGRAGADPLPAVCRALWTRARASGIALGALYVVDRPPTGARPARGADAPRGRGGAPGRVPPGQRRRVGARGRRARDGANAAARTRARRPPRPRPRTVDEDWDEEAAAWRLARALALAWDVPALLPLRDLARELVATERLRHDHQAAARLAGVTRPEAALEAAPGTNG